MSESDKDHLSTLDLLLDLQNDDDEIFPGRPSIVQQQPQQSRQQEPPPLPPPSSLSQPADTTTQPVAAPAPASLPPPSEQTDDFLIPTPPPPDPTDELLFIPEPEPTPQLTEIQDAPPPPPEQQQEQQQSRPPPPPSTFRTISYKLTPPNSQTKNDDDNSSERQQQPDADAATNDISFTFEDTGPGYDYQKKKTPSDNLVLPSKTIEDALEPRQNYPPPSSSSKKNDDALVGMEVPLLSSSTHPPKNRSLSDPYEGDDERAASGSLLGDSHASTYTPLSFYTKYEGPCCSKRDIVMALILLAVVLTGGILIVKSQEGGSPPGPPTYPPTMSPVTVAPVVMPSGRPSGRPSGAPTDVPPEITFEPTESPTAMPVTEAPVTESPTTTAPATESPTVMPVTESPTAMPVTESPVTTPPTSLTSYCGTDVIDAASCRTPCPDGICETLGETCFDEVTTCTAYENYCGTTLEEAKERCDATCPSGKDFECGEGMTCWIDVAECVKR